MSGWRLLRVLCLCTAFAWAPLSHGEEQSVAALLQQADALRSADARRRNKWVCEPNAWSTPASSTAM